MPNKSVAAHEELLRKKAHEQRLKAASSAIPHSNPLFEKKLKDRQRRSSNHSTSVTSSSSSVSRPLSARSHASSQEQSHHSHSTSVSSTSSKSSAAQSSSSVLSFSKVPSDHLQPSGRYNRPLSAPKKAVQSETRSPEEASTEEEEKEAVVSDMEELELDELADAELAREDGLELEVRMASLQRMLQAHNVTMSLVKHELDNWYTAQLTGDREESEEEVDDDEDEDEDEDEEEDEEAACQDVKEAREGQDDEETQQEEAAVEAPSETVQVDEAKASGGGECEGCVCEEVLAEAAPLSLTAGQREEHEDLKAAAVTIASERGEEEEEEDEESKYEDDFEELEEEQRLSLTQTVPAEEEDWDSMSMSANESCLLSLSEWPLRASQSLRRSQNTGVLSASACSLATGLAPRSSQQASDFVTVIKLDKTLPLSSSSSSSSLLGTRSSLNSTLGRSCFNDTELGYLEDSFESFHEEDEEGNTHRSLTRPAE